MASGFPSPRFELCRRINPSPFTAQLGSDDRGGFMLVSATSGRHWHVTNSVRVCLYGEVLRAVEIARTPSSGQWGPRGLGHHAIKKMSVERISRMEGRANEDPLKEVAALQYLKAQGPHPNVIEVTEVLRDSVHVYVVFPFCEGGELFSVVSQQRRLSEDVARPIFRGLLAGMAFLHGLRICHRDMSLENILLVTGGPVKIIDFGMALMVSSPQGRRGGAVASTSGGGRGGGGGSRGGGDSSAGRRSDSGGGSGGQSGGGGGSSIQANGPCGKKHYMAPEVAMSEEAFDGFAVDVWACGVILFIMLAGIPPFHIPIPSQDQRCRVIAVERRLLELVRGWDLPLSAEAVSLIQSCLLYNPGDRATVQDLLRHPWLEA